MILHLINIVIRVIIIIVGIVLLSGIFMPENFDHQMMRFFGVIMILYGIYRIVTYYSSRNRYKSREQNDTD